MPCLSVSGHQGLTLQNSKLTAMKCFLLQQFSWSWGRFSNRTVTRTVFYKVYSLNPLGVSQFFSSTFYLLSLFLKPLLLKMPFRASLSVSKFRIKGKTVCDYKHTMGNNELVLKIPAGKWSRCNSWDLPAGVAVPIPGWWGASAADEDAPPGGPADTLAENLSLL